MNLRKLRIWLLLFALTPLAAAQFTLVSGTVVDPNGLPYANGTITPTLISSGSPTLSGAAYTPPTQPVGLSQVGGFAMQLADNTQLSPGGSQWQFLVCSATGTVLPSGGNGPICFILASITVSGASQDISTQLQSAATSLTSINSASPIFSMASTGVSMSTSASAVIVGPTTMTTPASAGTYRFTLEIALTAIGTGGTCTTGNVGVNLSYKNPDSNVTYAVGTSLWGLWHTVVGSALTQTTTTMAGGVPGSGNDNILFPMDFRAAAGTAIKFQVFENAASNCAIPPIITVRPALYRLGY